MSWPSDSARKRIADLFALANDAASFLGERDNALAGLKKLQKEHELTDVEIVFIAEQERQGSKSINPLELVLHLLSTRRIMVGLEQSIVIALWVLHTHIYKQFLHTPRLIVRSTEPGCGKTALLKLIEQLTPDAFYSDDVTVASIYHALEEQPGCTLLLDELENSRLWDEGRALLRILDAGHRAGGRITRYGGSKHGVIAYNVFAPVVVAAVPRQAFDARLLSRSILVEMERNPLGQDTVSRDDPEFIGARSLLTAWAREFKRPDDVSLPAFLIARSADNWRALVAVADSLGYGGTARACARALHRPDENPADRLMLDSRSLYDAVGGDRIERDDYHARLLALPAHWDEYRGPRDNEEPHKIRLGELLNLLRSKGIRTRNFWRPQAAGLPRRSVKGFYWEQFERAWAALGATPPQSNKIIELHRHTTRHTNQEDAI